MYAHTARTSNPNRQTLIKNHKTRSSTPGKKHIEETLHPNSRSPELPKPLNPKLLNPGLLRSSRI